MITFDFYEEIKISQVPMNFEQLKQKISELYTLKNEQINHIIIFYVEEDDTRKYISNDYDFENVLPFIELYIINIEITDIDYYLIDEEKPIIKFSKFLASSESTIKKDNKQYLEKNLDEEKIIEDMIEENEEFYENKYNEEDFNEKKEKKINLEIICNCCNNNIKGIRYLCGICENFNLCEDCEKKIGKEHGHPLLKIRSNKMCPISFRCALKDQDSEHI